MSTTASVTPVRGRRVEQRAPVSAGATVLLASLLGFFMLCLDATAVNVALPGIGRTLGGTTALPNQTGTAVYQDGMWKVGDVSFCQLLKIENAGTTVSVCK